jgi:hypothetical protein
MPYLLSSDFIAQVFRVSPQYTQETQNDLLESSLDTKLLHAPNQETFPDAGRGVQVSVQHVPSRMLTCVFTLSRVTCLPLPRHVMLSQHEEYQIVHASMFHALFPCKFQDAPALCSKGGENVVQSRERNFRLSMPYVDT